MNGNSLAMYIFVLLVSEVSEITDLRYLLASLTQYNTRVNCSFMMVVHNKLLLLSTIVNSFAPPLIVST